MKIGNLEVYGIIYKIINKVNGKVYIGQTTRGFSNRYDSKGDWLIEKVYNYHKRKKNNNSHYNRHLFYAIEKYGFENFLVVEVYDVAFSQKELNIKEEIYINKHNSLQAGYNKKHGGSNGKLAEETKKKLSIINKGKNHPLFNVKGKNHPLYKREEVVCAYCQKKFEKAPCVIKKYNYCSNDCYNKDYKIKEQISKKLKENYKKGYKSPVEKAVICVNTGEVFSSVTKASIKYNIDGSSIAKCCRGVRKSAGKHPINGEKLIWVYIDKK